jgi:hypothetical protein
VNRTSGAAATVVGLCLSTIALAGESKLAAQNSLRKNSAKPSTAAKAVHHDPAVEQTTKSGQTLRWRSVKPVNHEEPVASEKPAAKSASPRPSLWAAGASKSVLTKKQQAGALADPFGDKAGLAQAGQSGTSAPRTGSSGAAGSPSPTGRGPTATGQTTKPDSNLRSPLSTDDDLEPSSETTIPRPNPFDETRDSAAEDFGAPDQPFSTEDPEMEESTDAPGTLPAERAPIDLKTRDPLDLDAPRPMPRTEEEGDAGTIPSPIDSFGELQERPLTAESCDDNEECRKALKALKEGSLADIGLDISVSGDEGNDFPCECPLGEGEQFTARLWESTTYTWRASALCHKPLYFEQVHLERYGHSWGPYVDPVISAAHFFGSIPLLPYKMGLEPPHECIYTLGYYRPGNCAPYLLDPIPISPRGALFQAGAVVGAGAIVP